MVGNQFFYELFNLGIAVVELAAFLSGEYHILDSFHLCRRTGQTDLLRVCFHESCAPLLNVEVGTLFKERLAFV